MTTAPEQLRISPEPTSTPVTEKYAAEILLTSACLNRLSGKRTVREEDGSLSQAVTLYSPQFLRVRRLKLTGLVDIDGKILAKGDVSQGLLVAGYQLDRFGHFQKYLPALRLPRIVNSRKPIGLEQRSTAEELMEIGEEVRNARVRTPEWFDRLRAEHPYLSVNI